MDVIPDQGNNLLHPRMLQDAARNISPPRPRPRVYQINARSAVRVSNVTSQFSCSPSAGLMRWVRARSEDGAGVSPRERRAPASARVSAINNGLVAAHAV